MVIIIWCSLDAQLTSILWIHLLTADAFHDGGATWLLDILQFFFSVPSFSKLFEF
jgi:hypothetical protein